MKVGFEKAERKAVLDRNKGMAKLLALVRNAVPLG
jgi:hypothetical protein